MEVRPAGEDAAVEDAPVDHGDLSLEAGGPQFRQRRLLEQREAAGQEEAVELGLAREPDQHLHLVHAGPHGADHAFAP